MSAHAGAGRGNKKSLVPPDSMLAPDFQHFHIHCIMVVVNHSLCLCSLGTAIHLADFPKVFAVTCGLPPLGIYYISEEIINNTVDALTCIYQDWNEFAFIWPCKPIYLYREQKFLFSSANMTEKAVTHKCSLRVTLPSLALEKKKIP